MDGKPVANQKNLKEHNATLKGHPLCWHTKKTVCTNEQGIAEIEGYRGDYIAKCGNMQGMFKLEKKPQV